MLLQDFRPPPPPPMMMTVWTSPAKLLPPHVREDCRYLSTQEGPRRRHRHRRRRPRRKPAVYEPTVVTTQGDSGPCLR